mmetsp:Transcript_6413/g.9129  ORF Transcript_6413/g.9129 Transcript_6413/m.9129 type:complete len:92 (-) Transcript_6413:247-522(-)
MSEAVGLTTIEDGDSIHIFRSRVVRFSQPGVLLKASGSKAHPMLMWRWQRNRPARNKVFGVETLAYVLSTFEVTDDDFRDLSGERRLSLVY